MFMLHFKAVVSSKSVGCSLQVERTHDVLVTLWLSHKVMVRGLCFFLDFVQVCLRVRAAPERQPAPRRRRRRW